LSRKTILEIAENFFPHGRVVSNQERALEKRVANFTYYSVR
jgi:hypothetical protein